MLNELEMYSSFNFTLRLLFDIMYDCALLW